MTNLIRQYYYYINIIVKHLGHSMPASFADVTGLLDICAVWLAKHVWLYLPTPCHCVEK